MRDASRIPALPLLGAIAWIVPASLRDEWRDEWLGEMTYYWERRGPHRRARLELYRRAGGALADALWLRRSHGGEHMLGHDLRFALRSLLRRPAFSATVILTLALGIGATTSIFSVVNGVLLRSLPYGDPERLVLIRGVPTDTDTSKVASAASYPDLVDYRAAAKSFEHLAAFRFWEYTVTGRDREPTVLTGAAISANLLPALRVQPALGRPFTLEEEQRGEERLVLLSDALWRGRYGSDPGILGRTINIDGNPHTVVGVMPRGFNFPREAQIWIPLVPDEVEQRRGVHRYGLLARLGNGVTRESAEAEMRGIAKQLENQYPEDNAKRTVLLVPLQEQLVRNVRPAIMVLFGAVVVMLLIVCANVANLVLARAAAREREVAVRAALGAERGTLVRQFLTESVTLALVGGTLGLAVAYWGTKLLVANVPQEVPRAAEIGIDPMVLLFALGVSLLTGVVFGIAPAIQYTRPRSVEGLREGRGTTGSVARRRVRQVLVVAEVALAVVLVIGAGLLAKSFQQLQRVDPGFEPRGLLTTQVRLPTSQYDREKTRTFYHQLVERLSNTPGITDVAVSMEHPLSPGWTTSFWIEGRPEPAPGLAPEARVRPVLPGYFRTTGVRLLRGRDIAETDRAESPGVVVINESFARTHFRGEDPIGRRLLRNPWWDGMPSSFEIVGIVADERYLGLDRETDPATYFAFEHFPLNNMYVTVKTDGDPLALVPALRRAIWAQDRDIPLDDVRPLGELLRETLAAPRFNTALLTLFAAIALLLAAIGIYGLLAFTVAQRTGEIGIRMALGAQRSNVVRLVVRQAVMLAGIGLLLGIVAASWATGTLERLLFEVSARDRTVFGSVAVVLSLVALFAAYLPARRASRIDPMIALRSE
ncbi:MAG TPA: ABC transporter permease [Gemmatimonadaceae bacterium]|nr:ABC transporter permease [Gemmatimonadaceae bacterium]